jgi:Asp-tRNA(Asn)/Glu-tRNA(Gln) amidotransferase A subunit family amidase
VPPSEDSGDEDNIGGPGTPVSITFLGALYGEAKMLALARAFQDATDFHTKHPKL